MLCALCVSTRSGLEPDLNGSLPLNLPATCGNDLTRKAQEGQERALWKRPALWPGLRLRKAVRKAVRMSLGCTTCHFDRVLASQHPQLEPSCFVASALRDGGLQSQEMSRKNPGFIVDHCTTLYHGFQIPESSFHAFSRHPVRPGVGR